MLDVAFQPDRHGSQPLYRQLEDHLRDLIGSGRLQAGERLPASRELAERLGLSRNTVNLAYQSLSDAGLLRARVGRGTFVAAAAGAARESGRPAPPRGFAWGGLLARRSRLLAPPAGFAAEALEERFPFDFRGGQVDAASLPIAELKRAHARALARLPELGDHRDPRGLPALREGVARSLVSRGIGCDPDDVLVTNGAQQALDLVARLLVDPGDTVALEQPGYFGATTVFTAAEGHLVGVGVDREGLRVDELARLLRARRVKLLFTTPAVQSPTGVTLSQTRRRELLALADEFQLPIVEDDYDSELRYGGPPLPALKTLDEAGRVIYLGTFTKALFPGLRIGYLVAPRPVLTRLVVARWANDVQTDLVSQAAVAELLASGGLERHVRKVRRIYAARREALLASLERHLPEGASWIEPAGGNGVWATLPRTVDPQQLFAASREAGIAYTRGDVFTFDGSGREHLSLSFAGCDEARIEEGIATLGRLALECRRRSAA